MSTVPPDHLRLKRVYEPPADDDGLRILVDRLWPRGLSRERAALDGWHKELAPSTELRKWFHHDASEFEEFRHRYLIELDAQEPALAALREQARGQVVTLLYGAHDPVHNQAVVLRDRLLEG